MNKTMRQFYFCPMPPKAGQEIREDFKSMIKWIKVNVKNAEIIIFAENEYVIDYCNLENLLYVEKNLFVTKDTNMPCTQKMFKQVHDRKLKESYQIYMNDDLILNKRFKDLLNFADDLKGNFLITGSRENVETVSKSFSVKAKYQHWGTDYFIFKLPMPISVKPFVYGRYSWDAHMINNVYKNKTRANIKTIDSSYLFKPLHLNRDYHWGSEGNTNARQLNLSRLIFRNLKLIKINDWHTIKSFDWYLEKSSVTGGTILLKPSSIKRKYLDFIQKIRHVTSHIRLYFLNWMYKNNNKARNNAD